MTRISKNPVNEEVIEKIFDLLFEVVGKKFKQEEFINVLHDLLSSTERIMIAKRVAIIYMLMKKIDYQIISDSLKVSAATIAKFNIIQENSRGMVKALQKIVENEKIFGFFEKIMIEFRGPGTYGVDWKSAWKQKIDYEKRKSRGI